MAGVPFEVHDSTIQVWRNDDLVLDGCGCVLHGHYDDRNHLDQTISEDAAIISCGLNGLPYTRYQSHPGKEKSETTHFGDRYGALSETDNGLDNGREKVGHITGEIENELEAFYATHGA